MENDKKLHQARLNNNCPTCFGTDGLEFTPKASAKTCSLKNPPQILKEACTAITVKIPSIRSIGRVT